jgi:hypothetical protein
MDRPVKPGDGKGGRAMTGNGHPVMARLDRAIHD